MNYTCEINNVNAIGSTTITCTVGNGVCGGGTTSITQHITVVPQTNLRETPTMQLMVGTVLVSNPIVVPKDNTATIVGTVLGSIIAILLIIIAFLFVKLYRNKKSKTSHPRSEGNTNTAADDYVELNQQPTAAILASPLW
ncbi:uncharacterized protein LOC144747070 [Ciona intestinalis]